MGAIARFFGLERRDATTFANVRASDPYMASLFGGRTGPLATVTVDEVLAASGVAFRCVDLIASGLASVPLVVSRRLADGSREPVEDHALSRILNEAATESMSGPELRECVTRDVAAFGNGYAEIIRDAAGRVAGLQYLPYRQVAVERLRTNRLRYRWTDERGLQRFLLPEEVCHIRVNSDGAMGHSPLSKASGVSSLVVRQLELAGRQAEKGFAGDMVFETDAVFGTGEMADAAYTRLKNQLSQRIAAMGREPLALLLESGLKAKVLSQTGKESQFAEARMFQAEEIARCYGVPPSVLGLGRQSSYGSLSEEQRALRALCLSPWARRVESQLSLQLLTAEGRRSYSLEHDLSGLERGDLQARAVAYATLLQHEVINANEARVWEGLPRRDGGNTFRNPNLQPTGDRPAA